jgi:hypothetical protein
MAAEGLIPAYRLGTCWRFDLQQVLKAAYKPTRWEEQQNRKAKAATVDSSRTKPLTDEEFNKQMAQYRSNARPRGA